MAEKRITKSYDQEFKSQAVKLAQEIGGHKAADELGTPSGTIYAWVKAFKEGRLNAVDAVHTPKRALSLNEEMIELRKRVRDQDKEIRRLKEENEFLEEASKKQRLMFLAIKTEDGRIKEKISFYCKALGVTRQGFHNYLKTKDLPRKYQSLADIMLHICGEDECNDTYGRIRMHACCKSFFKYLKKNRTNRRIYHTLDEFRLDIFEYIENLYNNRLPHGAIGYKTPNELEAQYWDH